MNLRLFICQKYDKIDLRFFYFDVANGNSAISGVNR